jgi:hypothetical protein
MIIRCFLLWIVLASYASADQYQLKERRENESYALLFAAVTVIKDNAVVFNGMTDKLGRIDISVPNGSYKAEIQDSRGVKRSVNIQVEGTSSIKVVDVPAP